MRGFFLIQKREWAVVNNAAHPEDVVVSEGSMNEEAAAAYLILIT